jgi:hypothetical protein
MERHDVTGLGREGEVQEESHGAHTTPTTG